MQVYLFTPGADLLFLNEPNGSLTVPRETHRSKTSHYFDVLLLSAWKILQDQLGLKEENLLPLKNRPRVLLKEQIWFDGVKHLTQNIAISLLNREMLREISLDPEKYTGFAWYNLFRLPEKIEFGDKLSAEELKNKLVGPHRLRRRQY